MSSISTTRLTRRFGSLTAVNQLTLDLPDAGVIGLVGPNGSGKSTLIRMLLGLISATDGAAAVLGASIADRRPMQPELGRSSRTPPSCPRCRHEGT